MATNEAAATQLFYSLAQEAQPVAVQLLEAIRDMQPVPAPLVAAMACRFVGLYAARALLGSTQDPNAQAAIVQGFAELDKRISVAELLAGNVVIDDGVVEAVMNHRYRKDPLSAPAEDPTVFDIDSWEKKP